VAGQPAVLVPAQDGTTLTVTQDPVSYAADTAVGGDKRALVMLHQNDTATGRAQSVPITGTSAPPSPVTEAPVAEAPVTEAPVAEAPVTGSAPATSTATGTSTTAGSTPAG
jgi:hypothetical protein